VPISRHRLFLLAIVCVLVGVSCSRGCEESSAIKAPPKLEMKAFRTSSGGVREFMTLLGRRVSSLDWKAHGDLTHEAPDWEINLPDLGVAVTLSPGGRWGRLEVFELASGKRLSVSTPDSPCGRPVPHANHVDMICGDVLATLDLGAGALTRFASTPAEALEAFGNDLVLTAPQSGQVLRLDPAHGVVAGESLDLLRKGIDRWVVPVPAYEGPCFVALHAANEDRGEWTARFGCADRLLRMLWSDQHDLRCGENAKPLPVKQAGPLHLVLGNACTDNDPDANRTPPMLVNWAARKKFPGRPGVHGTIEDETGARITGALEAAVFAGKTTKIARGPNRIVVLDVAAEATLTAVAGGKVAWRLPVVLRDRHSTLALLGDHAVVRTEGADGVWSATVVDAAQGRIVYEDVRGPAAR
jgi:hypothetical protein